MEQVWLFRRSGTAGAWTWLARRDSVAVSAVPVNSTPIYTTLMLLYYYLLVQRCQQDPNYVMLLWL
jgi:hypothetical protein